MDNRTQEEQEFIESLELGEEFPIISANDMKIFKQKLKEIMQKILVTSRSIVCGTNRTGKTNTLQWLWYILMLMREEELIKNKTKITFFDPTLNLRYNFDSVPYVDRRKTQVIPLVKDLIIDIPFISSTSKREAVMEVLTNDYIHKQQLKEKYEGKIPYQDVYFIDEMQNVWSNKALKRKDGETALTIFSESSNYGMIIIGSTQRLADVAPEIIERTTYALCGHLSGDNDVAKLRRIAGTDVAKATKKLKQGEFIFVDTSTNFFDTIKFPKFVQTGKPYLYQGVETSCYVKRTYIS